MEWQYIYLMFVFFLAGVVPELTGFGVATVSMSLLPFVLPLYVAIPLVAIISMVSTGIVAFETKTSGLLKYILPLLLGSALGVFVGMLFLKVVDESSLRLALSTFLISYSLYGLLFKDHFFPFNRLTGVLTGSVAGFFAASFNIHGPLVGLYSSSNDSLSKLEIKDLLATYMFFTGLFTVAGHTISGRIGFEVLSYFLLAVPFLFLGLFVGKKIFDKINVFWVKKGIYFFVLAAGIILLF